MTEPGITSAHVQAARNISYGPIVPEPADEDDQTSGPGHGPGGQPQTTEAELASEETPAETTAKTKTK